MAFGKVSALAFEFGGFGVTFQREERAAGRTLGA
jgi:hypothetical protein